MNRRKFISSSALGAGALSVFPTSVLANTTNSMGSMMQASKSISLASASSDLQKTHQNLAAKLSKSGYVYNENKLIKLTNSCYAIPVEKKSILGFRSNELALIVKDANSYNYYILEEKVSQELSDLVKNYEENMKSYGFEYNSSDFAFPTKVIEENKGKESIFSFKNGMNNTITIKSSRKKTRAVIC